MKTLGRAALAILIVGLVAGCSGVVGYGRGAKTITPSRVAVTEAREVDGFSRIDVHAFGRVVLTEGDAESLTITGPDNLIPLIVTSVRNGVLVIELEKGINVVNSSRADLLTFDIAVQDLTGLTVSGLASVEMETLTTTTLDVTVSGAGRVQLGQLAAKRLDIRLSGIGNVEAAGEAVHATIEISGAGDVHAADLKCQTADVSVPGLGSATVWVTDALSGKISGAGNISYYGDPETDTDSTGLGRFKALGSK